MAHTKKIWNPTTRVKKIADLIKLSINIPDDKKKNLSFISENTYGLPKIHKPDIPLQSVVSAIGSATHPIAKLIAEELQPFVRRTCLFISDSADFVRKIECLALGQKDILVSLTLFYFSQTFLKATESLLAPDLYRLASPRLKST